MISLGLQFAIIAGVQNNNYAACGILDSPVMLTRMMTDGHEDMYSAKVATYSARFGLHATKIINIVLIILWPLLISNQLQTVRITFLFKMYLDSVYSKMGTLYSMLRCSTYGPTVNVSITNYFIDIAAFLDTFSTFVFECIDEH